MLVKVYLGQKTDDGFKASSVHTFVPTGDNNPATLAAQFAALACDTNSEMDSLVEITRDAPKPIKLT